jgi:hypothetical protein
MKGLFPRRLTERPHLEQSPSFSPAPLFGVRGMSITHHGGGQFLTQAEFARRRGISREAVRKRTVTAGGPIPVHGPRKLIDPDKADGLWQPTMSAAGAANSRFRGAAERRPADPLPASGGQLAQARAAALVLDVQTKRLTLEQRRGSLISRDRAVLRCFAFARLLRDAWLAWPTRVGPEIAAAFEVDATALTIVLEARVREHLEQLARERAEF